MSSCTTVASTSRTCARNRQPEVRNNSRPKLNPNIKTDKTNPDALLQFPTSRADALCSSRMPTPHGVCPETDRLAAEVATVSARIKTVLDEVDEVKAQIKTVMDEIVKVKAGLSDVRSDPLDQRLPGLEKEKQILREECVELRKELVELRKEWNILLGKGASPSSPTTIDIIIPPEYLRLAQVVGLSPVTQGPRKVVQKVAELDPSIPYTHVPSSKKAFARILGEARHLQLAREDEMGRAMLVHLTSAEPHEGYELKEDLRLQLASSGKICEDDVVIVGKSKAWIGSHKTHAKGAKPVVEIAERAKDLAIVSTQLSAQVLPAFMVERVDADTERKISKACKDLHVLRFHRSGHAIKV
ncbi:uncharacterized protein HaLaN_09515, partial [Haematococcus lacustris]